MSTRPRSGFGNQSVDPHTQTPFHKFHVDNPVVPQVSISSPEEVLTKLPAVGLGLCQQLRAWFLFASARNNTSK
eukprot:763022-Amphidinium_carterae.1